MQPLPSPDPGKTSYEKQGNATDAGPIADRDIEVLPTWRPDEIPQDARLAMIDPAHHDGEYGSMDGSHPKHDERTAGAWPSDKLHQSGEGDDAIGPDRFARDGGTKRK
jgi:hypothetical protein